MANPFNGGNFLGSDAHKRRPLIRAEFMDFQHEMQQTLHETQYALHDI